MSKLITGSPESILGNKSYRNIREKLLNDYSVLNIADLSGKIFEAGTKTLILYFSDDQETNQPIIMTSGNDGQTSSTLSRTEVLTNSDLILIPNYWQNKNIVCEGYYSLTFAEMMKEKIIETNKNGNLPSGDEIGSANYLKDETIPFVRTSDIASLQIIDNPAHFTSEEIYLKYKDRQDIKPLDILFVRDGGRKVGDCAIIMPNQEKIIIQSHILKLRIKENKRGIDCWNFLYALYSKRTKEQIANLLFRLTIPSIANRVKELALFFPKDKEQLLKNSRILRELFQRRSELNQELRAIFNQIDPDIVRVFPNKTRKTFNEWMAEQK